MGNSMKPITPVILSGGAGSRLWPLSTQDKPKQFHALHGPNTMFADTLARILPGQALCFGSPIVVCGVDHAVRVGEELDHANITGARLILEPSARNTAPALAVAALLQAELDDDALMLVLPADHVIASPNQLHQACVDAREIAQSGKLVTFAIKPLSPETGYGYIKSGPALTGRVFAIEAFVEKPNLETAQAYLADGSYSWNAGIFFFKASALIAQLQLHAPQVLEQARQALAKSKRDGALIELDDVSFAGAPSISIDYAVMEPTMHGAVIPVDMGWNDVGSFATLWELANKDETGNAMAGPAALFDTTNCFVSAEAIPVALIGVSDLIVVSTPQGILITSRDRAQDVRLAAQAFKD
jgi:mannose-1-phosphate guanylyltransferase / mannose-6-phosphate isomerase